MNVETVIFDFGGVFTFEWRTRELFNAYDRELGLPPGTLINYLYTGETWELVSTGEISEDEYMRRLQAHWEGSWPASLEAFKHGRVQAEGINRRVVQLALALRKEHNLALLSNATISLRSYLSELRLLDLFDVVVLSAEVGLRKPNPAIYSLTANLAETDPALCLMIDNLERNTSVAESLGMQAVVFKSAAQLQQTLLTEGVLTKRVF
jgi:HAD superfamily hydrolase (TIGR01509 family)